MEDSSSPAFLTSKEQTHLLKLAKTSIEHGVEHGQPSESSKEDCFGRLGEKGASFVTLLKKGQLRGCIGYLEARRQLAVDVIENAYASAFKDARFSPLLPDELNDLEIKISVLSSSIPVQFNSEEDLLNQLRPGIDGLILHHGSHRGTFLPSVWEDLTRPSSFLNHLKQKAGLAPNFWSNGIEISRYTTEEFGEEHV